MNDIALNLQQIRSQIDLACQQTNRDSTHVQLLAVSKTKPVESILAAYLAGQRQFGESYVQDAIPKIEQISKNQQINDIEWHFIGPLQSNKTRPVAEHFSWVHSIDRLKIAQRLNEQRPDDQPKLNICIQVNISGETTKSGIEPNQVLELAESLQTLPMIQLRGLMCIAENTEDLSVVKTNFQSMLQLFNELKTRYPSVDTLSMGMTDDMKVAIECGSTMVRIGTAIFGSREYK